MKASSKCTEDTPDFLPLLRSRVSEDLQLLATLHDREPDNTLLQGLRDLDFPSCLTLTLDTEAGASAVQLMGNALHDLPAVADQAILDFLAADYASIYLNHNIQASPEESVWLDEDSLMCQESMFQVRAWYESCGLGIDNWRQRPDDHLVYQLQFISWLLRRDDQMETLEQAACFMDEHLLRWLGNFGERVLTRCDSQYFASAAALSAAYCESLRDILAQVLQQPRPSRQEIEDRMQPRTAPESVTVKFTPGVGPAV